jgi:hypothetical protein
LVEARPETTTHTHTHASTHTYIIYIHTHLYGYGHNTPTPHIRTHPPIRSFPQGLLRAVRPVPWIALWLGAGLAPPAEAGGGHLFWSVFVLCICIWFVCVIVWVFVGGGGGWVGGGLPPLLRRAAAICFGAYLFVCVIVWVFVVVGGGGGWVCGGGWMCWLGGARY